MSAEIINESGEPDADGEFKTYDLLIEHAGESYWKFGMTGMRLAKRFSREPNTTRIIIRKLWRHKSEAKASTHESSLFRRHKGDRPFIGKMGPLLGGGNTEVYSHDVANGEIAPHQFKVILINPQGRRETLTCYSDYDPYSRWDTQYSWVEASLFPQFDALLVQEKSDEKKITICSVDHLENVASGRGSSALSKNIALQTLNEFSWVENYASAYKIISAKAPYQPTFASRPVSIGTPGRYLNLLIAKRLAKP